jgi:hypothetical protein
MLDQLISDDDEARKFILKGTDIAFTSNTQNKIYKVLKKMINTGLDVGEIHYSFSLLLLNYPDLRTLYVEKTTSARGIVNLLNVGLKNQKENITNQEESILIDKIAKEFLRIPLDELSQEVQDRILPIIFNKLVANEAISFVNKDDGLYAYVHERVFSFTNNIELGSPFGANKYLTEENKNKIMKLCTRLNDFYPPEIPGYVEFGLDRSFIPEMKLESKIQELISGIKNFKSDLNTNDLVEGLIRFGNINKIKAVAKRVDSTNAEAIFEYEVFMIFDVNIIETKQRLYDKEVLQLMQKKEVELQAILEQNLNIDTDRTFGFELEFSTNRPKNQIKEKLMSTIGNEIHEVNVIDSYMSSSGKFWDLKVDSSVNPTLGFSIELASPIKR